MLTAGQREHIIKFFEAQNERIRLKHFPERETMFKPIDHKKYRYLSESEVALEQRRILMHLLYAMWQKNNA